MSAPTEPAPDTSGADTVPATPTGGDSPKRSLEDSLSTLDDSTRAFVLGQVSKARTEAQNLRERLKAAEPKLTEYEQLVQASKTAEQRTADDLARWQSEAETWRGAAVGNRIEALAGSDFADPSDAVGQLSANNYLNAGGQIDEAAIKADLAALLDRKPHWRRQDGVGTPRIPAPNRAQGLPPSTAPADPGSEFAALIQAQLRG